MEQVHKERWTKLFEYLEGVDPSEFNMRSFIDKFAGTRCAAGHLPLVFPSEWRMDSEHWVTATPVLINGSYRTTEALRDFFGAEDVGEMRELFKGGQFRDGWSPLDWIEHAMSVLKWEKDEANP